MRGRGGEVIASKKNALSLEQRFGLIIIVIMRAADLISPSTIAHTPLHKQPKSFVPVGCLWVIKINRLFLTDLLSLLQAQGSGLLCFGPANALPARCRLALLAQHLWKRPQSQRWQGRGWCGSRKLALRSVSEGTTPNEADAGGPVVITGRTPKWGLPWAQGLGGGAQKGLPHPGLGTATSPGFAHCVCGPVNSGSW